MNYKFINTPINEYTFVDLGLPSGNLWAVENTITEFNFCDYFKTHAERISKADIFPEYFPSGTDYNELLEYCNYEFNESRAILTFYSKNNHSYLEFPVLKYRKNIYSAQYIAKNFTVLDILNSEVKVIKVSNWQISPYYIKLIKHG